MHADRDSPSLPPFARLLLVLLLLVLPDCGGGGGGGGSSAPHDPSEDQELPPVVIPELPPGAASERFFVIGDQGTGGPGQYLVAEVMGLKATADGLDYVLTTGDNIYPNGVSSPDDPDWITRFEDPYAAPVLEVPFYASLGNHDHVGDADAQVEYTANSDQWTMPARYYSVTRVLDDGTDVLLLALDTQPVAKGGSTGGQLAWLQDELEGSTARWKLAFGHHPIFAHGKHGDTPQMIEDVLPLLQAGGVDAYFCGHDHSLQLLEVPEAPLLVVSGAGSGTDKDTGVDYGEGTLYASTGGGFVAVRVSADQLLLEFVRLDGLTQFAHTIDK